MRACDTDAHRHVDLTPPDGEGLRQRVRQPFRHDLGGVGCEALHDQDHELVAAESREHVIHFEADVALVW